MSKFLNLTFLDGITERGVILNIDSISTYRADDEDETKTLVTTTDNSIPTSPVLKINMSEADFIDAIASSTDSPNSFITINCGNPISDKFFNYKLSVYNLSAVSYCMVSGFSTYNQIYIPGLGIFLCTLTSLSTIFTQLYA